MTGEDWLKLLLQSNVAAAVIVGLFGLLTLKMGIAKFASEKWWERKASSYVSVIEGLHKMYRCSRTLGEAAEKGYEYSEEYVEELSQESAAGFSEVQRGENIGSFLMTKQSAQILSALSEKLDAFDEPMSPIDFHTGRANCIYEAIIAMTIEAKNDLKTH